MENLSKGKWCGNIPRQLRDVQRQAGTASWNLQLMCGEARKA